MKSALKLRFIFPVIFLLIFSPVFHGCALLLVGGGAAGGYAVSRDEVEGAIDAKQSKVYRAALDTAKNKGIIRLQDEGRGYIEAMVEEVTVKIHVDKISERSVKLRVEARNKYKMPKIKIAQDIYTDVLKRVA